MNIKRMIFWLLCIGIASWSVTFADDQINLQWFLQSYFNVIIKDWMIPQSYKYIRVQYKDIPGSWFRDLLQKTIYLDMFPNIPAKLPLLAPVTQKQVSDIIQSKLPITIPYQEGAYVSTQWLAKVLLQVQTALQEIRQTYVINFDQSLDYGVLENMYQILDTEYVDSTKVKPASLLYGAAKGLAASLNDDYTSFMPPSQATDFSEEIQWQFEWIGAYVDTKRPWVIVIVAPIDGSPADKAWFLAWDQIINVDDHKVTQESQVNDVVWRIKGPRWTSVTLTIIRNNKELSITVIRDKIEVKNIETKIYTGGNCYINIRMFDMNVHQDFDSAMQKLTPSTCTRYTFDLRNNPGGSLDEVASMLEYFVPPGSPSVIIKGKGFNQTIVAEGNSGNRITEKNIVILMNGGSASASEIFVGGIKDYGSHVTLIGQKTFWKGSVQTMMEYPDGSIFKYTIAKRYTGKSQKNIDKIWIFPDKEIIDNLKTSDDEQLTYALGEKFR